jgi:uncharacterized protein (UPF0335 family)
MNKNKCIGCANTENLHKLQSGKYVCKICLDELGREQKDITDRILNILNEYDSLQNPFNQIKALEAIVLYIKLDNDLLSEDEMTNIINVYGDLNA